MNTYEANTYSLYTNTKDLSYKNGTIMTYLKTFVLTKEILIYHITNSLSLCLPRSKTS